MNGTITIIDRGAVRIHSYMAPDTSVNVTTQLIETPSRIIAVDAQLVLAYADEVLWEAKLHPKTMVRSLPDDVLDRLHDAIVTVVGGATKTIAKRRPPLDGKLRDFVKVRGRHGEPCPRCGTTIRSAGVHGHDADFCPTCQPDERGTSIVDWRKVPKG